MKHLITVVVCASALTLTPGIYTMQSAPKRTKNTDASFTPIHFSPQRGTDVQMMDYENEPVLCAM